MSGSGPNQPVLSLSSFAGTDLLDFRCSVHLDEDPSASVAESAVGCFLPGGGLPLAVPDGSSVVLGMLSYTAHDGTSAHELRQGSVWDPNITPLLSCFPFDEAQGFCSSGTVQIGDGSHTPTPTATATPCTVGEPGCPTATASNTPTATPSPGPTNPSTGGFPFGLLLDCDPSTSGIQSECRHAPWVHTASVDVVLVNNSGTDRILAAFNYRIRVDQLIANPPNIPGPSQANCRGAKLNCNPDFNEAIGGSGWSCDPASADWEVSVVIAESITACLNISDPRLLASGSSIVLGTVSYITTNGATPVELREVNIYDHQVTEFLSCNPELTAGGYCQNATLSFGVDNCPGVDNVDQANVNTEPIVLPKPAPKWNDVTNPAADYEGDACDPDIDGDGVTNGDEATLGLDVYDWDTDGDRTSDGAEVACGSNPTSAASTPNGPDGDIDGLPDACEAAFGTDPADRDSDDDAVSDGVEVRYWRSNPLAANTDGDECSDAKEISSLNGDRSVNSGDLLILALNYGPVAPSLWPYDANGDGVINSGDQLFAALVFGPCRG